MHKLNFLLIDNYDSFTYNLQHLFLMLPDVCLTVKRNNEDLISLMQQTQFNGIIIGPGPGSPEDEAYFGFNRQIILTYGTAGLPILGVCLGFQGIYHVFGGSLAVSPSPMHGKTSRLLITEPNNILLQGVADHTEVMRYHSIIADLTKPIPNCFKLIAYAAGTNNTPQELMAIAHKTYPIFGVQFHPESFATACGMQIIKNFITICRTKPAYPATGISTTTQK